MVKLVLNDLFVCNIPLRYQVEYQRCFVISRVDLVIGLPDLEQDIDHLMSSANSDSLEDILRSLGWEGQ